MKPTEFRKMSLAARQSFFLAWCRLQSPEKAYEFMDIRNCPLAQFGKFLFGGQKKRIHADDISILLGGLDEKSRHTVIMSSLGLAGGSLFKDIYADTKFTVADLEALPVEAREALFVAFVRAKDKNEAYTYMDSSNCPLAQFVRELTGRKVSAGASIVRWDCKAMLILQSPKIISSLSVGKKFGNIKV